MLSSSLYPISQQGAISPAPSSKQVLADSATTQARRQSWRELACRRAYIVQLTGFSSPTKRKNSSRQTYITLKGAETGVIREGLANISNLYQIKHRFFSPSVVLSMHVLLSLDVSALRHDCLPTLEPGTKSRISARFMAQGGSSGGCSSGGGGASAVLATCVRSPCASKFSGNPRRSLFGAWAFPERNFFRGLALAARSRPPEQVFAVLFFRFSRTKVCIALISLLRVNSFFGERTAASYRASSRIIHLLYLGPYFLSPSRNSYPRSHSRLFSPLLTACHEFS